MPLPSMTVLGITLTESRRQTGVVQINALLLLSSSLSTKGRRPLWVSLPWEKSHRRDLRNSYVLKESKNTTAIHMTIGLRPGHRRQPVPWSPGHPGIVLSSSWPTEENMQPGKSGKSHSVNSFMLWQSSLASSEEAIHKAVPGTWFCLIKWLYGSSFINLASYIYPRPRYSISFKT